MLLLICLYLVLSAAIMKNIKCLKYIQGAYKFLKKNEDGANIFKNIYPIQQNHFLKEDRLVLLPDKKEGCQWNQVLLYFIFIFFWHRLFMKKIFSTKSA